MERENAQKLMENISKIDSQINRMIEIISDMKDEQEQKRYRKSASMVVGLIYSDFIRPIIRDYPELDPDCDDDDEAST